MTERERLIAILNKAQAEAEDTIGSMNGGMAAWYADKLLEADIALVVHGHNLNDNWPSLFQCSVCGWESRDTYACDTEEFNYCPNCGAKMDGNCYEPQQQWIPVSERMPEENHHTSDIVFILRHTDGGLAPAVAYTIDGKWFSIVGVLHSRDVAYWMPQPKLSKEDT